ncbi:hypothetical protein GJ496_001397 [Pomphorhynchus laevis]|nr:hypothetical protein GJ496_001397 [Pomphorhynchus laevis]
MNAHRFKILKLLINLINFVSTREISCRIHVIVDNSLWNLTKEILHTDSDEHNYQFLRHFAQAITNFASNKFEDLNLGKDIRLLLELHNVTIFSSYYCKHMSATKVPFYKQIFCNSNTVRHEVLLAVSQLSYFYNDNKPICAHVLLTGKHIYEKSTYILGSAGLSTMCFKPKELPLSGWFAYNSAFVSVGAISNVLFQLNSIGLTFAHEVGHLMGAEHDKVELNNTHKYIMESIATNLNVDKYWWAFSRQSEIDIAHNIYRIITESHILKCLANDAHGKCGNGFLDYHEECDCGDDEHCCNCDNCTFNESCIQDYYNVSNAVLSDFDKAISAIRYLKSYNKTVNR